MLTIIHGDDTVSSRKYFLEQKNKYPELQVLDGEKVTLTDLAQIFDGGELFGSSKTIFLDQFFTKRKKSKEKENILESIQKYSKDNDIYLWESKELEKNVINSLKQAEIKVFKLPQSLFIFVDSIKPNNSKILINLFHKTLSTTEEEMVFFMLIRQFRLLLAISNDSNERIDEIKRLAPWQLSKLQNQSKQFTSEQLMSLYNKLFELEIAQKTGNLSSTLSTSIDFLLLEI